MKTCLICCAWCDKSCPNNASGVGPTEQAKACWQDEVRRFQERVKICMEESKDVTPATSQLLSDK